VESGTEANPDGFKAVDGTLSVIHSGHVLLPHSREVRPIHFDTPVLALERGDVPCFTAAFQKNAGTTPGESAGTIPEVDAWYKLRPS
jgi:hypothetical protein